MENFNASQIDTLIAQRLKSLRHERGWSLDELAQRSQISRTSLSRLENAEVSGSATVLGKLCHAFGISMSRLMQMVETRFEPLIVQARQTVWNDSETGYRRVIVSPPADSLNGEVLDCRLAPATRIEYAGSPRAGMEHHLVLIEGSLAMTVNDQTYALSAGDCLRYQLDGPSCFQAGAAGARYYLFIV